MVFQLFIRKWVECRRALSGRSKVQKILEDKTYNLRSSRIAGTLLSVERDFVHEASPTKNGDKTPSLSNLFKLK